MTTDRCSTCGEPEPAAGSTCPRCGRSLLVDVLAPPGLDERMRFQAARAVATLGPPAPDFAQARARLSAASPVPLVRGVSSAFSRAVLGALAKVDVHATVRASAIEPNPSASPRKATSKASYVLAAVLVAVAIAGGVFFIVKHRASAPGAPSSLAASPASVAAPAPATPETIARPTPERLVASAASISCGNRIGSGFFVGEETLLTNAHVVCPDAATLTVRLRDGRELLGLPLKRDEWLDFATVRVIGAAAQPFSLGETAALEPGDPIVFVGSPKGLEFTLHEGKVAFVGRNHLGVGYIQINATVNPGNSGGPLLNARGEVVGLVTLKVTDAEGIGLALPIEYPVPPQEAGAKARWEAIVKTVAEEDRREVAKFREKHERVKLVALQAEAGGPPLAVVVQLWPGPPAETFLDLRLKTSHGACDIRGTVSTWLRLEEAAQKAKDNRFFTWLLRSGAGANIFAGAAPLRASSCQEALLDSQGTLVLRDGAADRDEVKVERGQLRGASSSALRLQDERRQAEVDHRRERVEALESQQRSREEPIWKERFRGARARIEEVGRKAEDARGLVERLDRQVGSGRYRLTPEGLAKYERAKDTLRNNEADVRKAEEELHELERQAALHAVPLEWRR